MMVSDYKIRGYHTDMFGHVNNARYLEFLEDARWQLLDEFFEIENFLTQKFLFFVVNINISYRSQAKPNDIITIHSGLKRIGNKSAVLEQRIINETTKADCVTADVTFVIADAAGTPLKIEGDLKKMIQRIPKLTG